MGIGSAAAGLKAFCSAKIAPIAAAQPKILVDFRIIRPPDHTSLPLPSKSQANYETVPNRHSKLPMGRISAHFRGETLLSALPSGWPSHCDATDRLISAHRCSDCHHERRRRSGLVRLLKAHACSVTRHTERMIVPPMQACQFFRDEDHRDETRSGDAWRPVRAQVL
ncbi:hypothetical protein [Bradyrhizobium sp. LVM 105]|uniref:hypothetical protein n=1 Tax=Bradyrhizobium sp. LVM 105 TaxID=2341115 RepID=UPI0013DEFDEB|nr:hypothetical protein [Bradyrhizobium sp. LVM 105]